MKDGNKNNWDMVPLGELCQFQGGTQPPKSKFIYEPKNGYVRLLQIRDFKSDEKAVFVPDDGKLKKCKTEDIMIGRYGASVGQIHRGKAGAYNVALIRSTPDLERLDRDYLYHYLTSDLFQKPLLARSARGAQNGFNRADIAPFPVPLPPLEEQQRIVAVLDAAFEGLARARENAELNLQNARELLRSSIQETLTPGSSGWVEKTVAATLQKVRVPNKVKRKEYLAEGEFPIVSQEAALISGYWNDPADVIRVERPLVVFGDHTRALKFVDFDFVVGADGTQLMAPIQELDPEFYYFALRTISLEGKGYARHFSHLKKEKLFFPRDRSEQQAIASRLHELERLADELIATYRNKCSDLDELRQSLLQKAFAGELT